MLSAHDNNDDHSVPFCFSVHKRANMLTHMQTSICFFETDIISLLVGRMVGCMVPLIIKIENDLTRIRQTQSSNVMWLSSAFPKEP